MKHTARPPTIKPMQFKTCLDRQSNGKEHKSPSRPIAYRNVLSDIGGFFENLQGKYGLLEIRLG